MSKLSEALEAANRQGWSRREIARQAQRRGHNLTHATVSVYFKGDHGRPDEATLRALADALSTSLPRLREAAGIISDEHEPFELPAEASRLTRRQRAAVVSVVNAFLEPVAVEAHSDPETEISGKGSFGSVQDAPTRKQRRGKSA